MVLLYCGIMYYIKGYMIYNVLTYIKSHNTIHKEVMNRATTTINIRVDSELKQSAEELFNDLGLNMSSAITMFLKSAVSYDGIPFELKRNTPNTKTQIALSEYEEMKKNPENYKRYNSFDEIVKEVLEDA